MMMRSSSQLPGRLGSDRPTFRPSRPKKMRLVQIAEEMVSVLTSEQNATVGLVVQIPAELPDGAGDGVKRAVSEDARTLNLESADWE